MKKLALLIGYDTSIIVRESANLLIKNGYKIIAVCNDPPASESNIIFEQADLFSKESVLALIKRLKGYAFDAIVNGHAVLATTEKNDLRHEFFDFDYDAFDSTMRSNLTAIAAICIGLKDNINNNGCIINITSSAAEEGAFATISYNASKAALKNFSKSLSNNFGPYNGVRVNCVAPGWIPQNKNVVAGNIVDLANKITPLYPYGEPRNVAQAVLDLIGNPYANGTTYAVDGGITSSYMMYMLESLDLRGSDTSDRMKKLVETLDSVKKELSKE